MLPGGSLCLTPAHIGDAGVRGEERGCGEAEIPVKMLQRAGIFFSLPVSPEREKPRPSSVSQVTVQASGRKCGTAIGTGSRVTDWGGRLGFPLGIPFCLVPSGGMATAVTGRPLSAGRV